LITVAAQRRTFTGFHLYALASELFMLAITLSLCERVGVRANHRVTSTLIQLLMLQEECSTVKMNR